MEKQSYSAMSDREFRNRKTRHGAEPDALSRISFFEIQLPILSLAENVETATGLSHDTDDTRHFGLKSGG